MRAKKSVTPRENDSHRQAQRPETHGVVRFHTTSICWADQICKSNKLTTLIKMRAASYPHRPLLGRPADFNAEGEENADTSRKLREQ